MTQTVVRPSSTPGLAQSHAVVTPPNLQAPSTPPSAPHAGAVFIDSFQMMLTEVAAQFCPLSRSFTVTLTSRATQVRELLREASRTWKALRPFPLLFVWCALSLQAEVSALNSELCDLNLKLYSAVCPIALEQAAKHADDFGGLGEAYSAANVTVLKAIDAFKPGKVGLEFWVEKFLQREFKKLAADIKGVDAKSVYKYQMIWRARASLEAYGLERSEHTPAMIASEIVAAGFSAREWTTESVIRLLADEPSAGSALSLEQPLSEDATLTLGDTLFAAKSLDDIEEEVLLEEASHAIGLLEQRGLKDLALHLPLSKMLAALDEGHEATVAFALRENVMVRDLQDIARVVSHLRYFA